MPVFTVCSRASLRYYRPADHARWQDTSGACRRREIESLTLPQLVQLAASRVPAHASRGGGSEEGNAGQGRAEESRAEELRATWWGWLSSAAVAPFSVDLACQPVPPHADPEAGVDRGGSDVASQTKEMEEACQKAEAMWAFLARVKPLMPVLKARAEHGAGRDRVATGKARQAQIASAYAAGARLGVGARAVRVAGGSGARAVGRNGYGCSGAEAAGDGKRPRNREVTDTRLLLGGCSASESGSHVWGPLRQGSSATLSPGQQWLWFTHNGSRPAGAQEQRRHIQVSLESSPRVPGSQGQVRHQTSKPPALRVGAGGGASAMKQCGAGGRDAARTTLPGPRTENLDDGRGGCVAGGDERNRLHKEVEELAARVAAARKLRIDELRLLAADLSNRAGVTWQGLA